MATSKDLLLITLVNSSQPMRISELKRATGVSIEKKELNILLYSLQERGLAEQTVENPPLWSATVAGSTIVENNENDNEEQRKVLTGEEQKLVRLLTEQGKEYGLSIGSIAAFLGKSVAMTNKVLYGLERNTKVIRRSKISPPIWTIPTSDNSTSVHNNGSHSSSSSSISESEKEDNSCAIIESSTQKRPKDDLDEPTGKRARLQSSSSKSDHSITKLASNKKPAVTLSLLLDDARKQKVREELSKYHDPKELKKEAPWAKKCSNAVWKKYRTLNSNAQASLLCTKIILLVKR